MFYEERLDLAANATGFNLRGSGVGSNVGPARHIYCAQYTTQKLTSKGGSRISEKGVQMWKRRVRLPNFTQNLFKFPMKLSRVKLVCFSFFVIRHSSTGEVSLFFVHYENLPMQYTEIFKVVKNEKFQ